MQMLVVQFVLRYIEFILKKIDSAEQIIRSNFSIG